MEEVFSEMGRKTQSQRPESAMAAAPESSQAFQESAAGFGRSLSSPGPSSSQAAQPHVQQGAPLPPSTRQADSDHDKVLKAEQKVQKAQWDGSIKQIRNASSEWQRRRRDLDNILARSGQHPKTMGANTEKELKDAMDGIDESDKKLKQHELDYQMKGNMSDTGITDIKEITEGMVDPIKNVSKLGAGLNVWMRL